MSNNIEKSNISAFSSKSLDLFIFEVYLTLKFFLSRNYSTSFPDKFSDNLLLQEIRNLPLKLSPMVLDARPLD